MTDANTADKADNDPTLGDIAELLAIMRRLRDPLRGCPWDLAQNFSTIAPYTIEEAYEVADAIARGDLDDLKDELGDLLLQVVFHSRMAEEDGAFDFGDVVETITRKLLRRHPHVFGEAEGLSPEAVEGLWHRIKQEEKAERAAARGGAPVWFPKIRSGRIRTVRQNQRIIAFDACDPPLACRIYRQSVQVAAPA
jgi:ATP diphosphatase